MVGTGPSSCPATSTDVTTCHSTATLTQDSSKKGSRDLSKASPSKLLARVWSGKNSKATAQEEPRHKGQQWEGNALTPRSDCSPSSHCKEP